MSDERFMHEALALARQGQGFVEPNPMVGAVIVREGRIIGRGWHKRFGGPHAEVEAIRDCRQQGQDPAGATMYVTLEPCRHHGKTPPCTDAIRQARLARVVVAMVDPSAHAAGAGAHELRQAGVEVEVGLCQHEAEQLNEPFLKRVRTGLPWVILKWAQTLDGKISSATGQSRWISSEVSRQRVHELRARCDAVMVGIGTVRADNPQLTARGVEVRRSAVRVVVDPDLKTPMGARLIQEERPPVLLAVRQRVLEEGGPVAAVWRAKHVALLGLPELDDGHLDLRPLMEHLAQQHQATNVLVEGGAGLAGSLLRQGLVDQILAFIAPKLAGDAQALSAVRGLAWPTPQQSLLLELRHMEKLGPDVLLDYRVQR